jgi:hypothetical protein
MEFLYAPLSARFSDSYINRGYADIPTLDQTPYTISLH